jgi:hypothetical protein
MRSSQYDKPFSHSSGPYDESTQDDEQNADDPGIEILHGAGVSGLAGTDDGQQDDRLTPVIKSATTPKAILPIPEAMLNRAE